MKLSLVTGTRNRPDALKRLIQSVLKHTPQPYEFLIGDASDEPARLNVPEHIVVWPEKPRLGHSRGYNHLFRLAEGEFIIWLNDDAEVMEGYAENAIAFMEAHPQIGLGALHYSENGGPFHVNSAWKCIYANFGIFRKDFGRRIGWFDEEIEMYGADNSITFRTLLAGKGVADIPNARILHHSMDDAVRRENQNGRIHDNRILTKKYIPLQDAWLNTYRRFQVHNQTEAWDHGRQPVGR